MKTDNFHFRHSGFLSLGVLFMILACPSWLFAVPANPEHAEVEQPDGKKFKIHLRGDEYFSWHEDAEGYVIKRDEKDNFWKYATPKKQDVGFDVLPDVIVGVSDPVKFKLKKGDLPDKKLLREYIKKQWNSQAKRLEDSTTGSLSISISPKEDALSSVTEPPPLPIPVVGTKTVKNIVILACFNDHWDTVNNTVMVSKGRTNATEYINLFNQIGHTNDDAVGSVKDYYLENSYGRLTVESVVTVWVRLPDNEAVYGAGNPDVNPRKMVTDSIAAADAAGFDFSQGDGDLDGWVDGLTIIHSGYGQEAGASSDSIWSHQWTISSPLVYDGCKLYKYHTSPALRNSYGTSIVRVGVICHEMGHFFGLPDLYDYGVTYNERSVGKWCIMSFGTWGGGDGKQPSHFSAWCKQSLGFVVPQLIHSQNGVPVPDVRTSSTVYMIRDGCLNEEYFLVENRAQTGFDASLPGRGIMVWHIDPKNPNNDSRFNEHPLVKMEDADGDEVANEATSAWYEGNSEMIPGGLRDQTTNIYTSTMAYQTGSYVTRTDSSASYTYVRISNFSTNSTTMTMNVSTLIPTVSSQSVNTAAYTVTWTPSTAATAYEIQEGETASTTTFSEGFEDNDDLHDQWVLAGCRRESANAQAGAYSMYFSRYDGSKWWDSVQSLRSRHAFTFTGSTTIQFYYLCRLGSGNGQFQLLASRDNGITWTPLWTHTGGLVDSWTAVTISATQLSSAGFASGDTLLFSFVMNAEYINGYYGSYPEYGWAIDDFLVSNTTSPAFTNWSTLSDAVATNAYGVTGKTNGTYAYRVRGYSNSSWQRYSPAATVTVRGVPRDTKATVILFF